MKLRPETVLAQKQLATYCLNAAQQSVPDTRVERLPVYRRLVFNQVINTLKRTYPLTAAIFSEEIFKEMAEEFFSRHECHSPFLWRMPEDFYKYAVYARWHEKYSSPALLDLLLLEWLEIDVFMMPDFAIPKLKPQGGLAEDILVLNPHHRLNHFQYPVFSRSLDDATKTPGNYFLVTYRHMETLKVRFMSLPPIYALAIESLNKQPQTWKMAVSTASTLLRQDIPQHGLEFIEHALSCGLFAGFAASPR
ncbi:MAG: DNA-binding domain-containing protein [bacterium]|nr:DNA-binding domain-containing protein [bacterium]